MKTSHMCLAAAWLLSSFLTSTAFAEKLLSRQDLFGSYETQQPIISTSGNWIANISGSGHAIELRNTAAINQAVVIKIPDIQQIHWHRWMNSSPERLMISGTRAGEDVVLAFDPISGQSSSLLSKDDERFLIYATFQNNYKFTLSRFQNTKKNQFFDLTPTGELLAVKSPYNAIPAYLQQERGFFAFISPLPHYMEWHFGLKKEKRTILRVTPPDTRHGTRLMSISSDNKAYVFSSVDSDTLNLAEYDLATGERVWLTQEKVDLSGILLNPLDGKPDAVIFENESPQQIILNPRIRADMAALSAKNWKMPVVKDRSSNDLFWLVQYPYKDGGTKWVWYDRRKKTVHDIPFFEHGKAADSGPRIREFAIKRPGEPDISGYVTLPKAGLCETKKCPAVFLLHGGPGVRDYAAHTAERTWLASRGIIVINVNFRGSSGFGKRYEALDIGQWYDGIPRDALAGFQYVLKNYPVDSQRVALMGTSFAASLALHLMAETPHFQCALVDSASTDETKFVEYALSKYGEHSDLLHRLGDPRKPEDRARLLALSPVAKIDKLKDRSIFLLHGTKDDITPISGVEEFVTKMLASSDKFLYAHMLNEGHGFATPSGREAFHALAEQYLAQCLSVPFEPITKKEYQSLQGNVSLFGKNLSIFKAPE